MQARSNALYAAAGAVLGALLALSLGAARSRAPRFVDTSAGYVLDTKTGQYCNGVTSRPNALPLCHDLYTGKIK